MIGGMTMFYEIRLVTDGFFLLLANSILGMPHQVPPGGATGSGEGSAAGDASSTVILVCRL